MMIGMLATEKNKGSLVLPILQALSGGSFVYLVCCSLLIQEFHQIKSQSKMLAASKMIFFMIGGSIVLALIAMAPDPHGH